MQTLPLLFPLSLLSSSISTASPSLLFLSLPHIYILSPSFPLSVAPLLIFLFAATSPPSLLSLISSLSSPLLSTATDLLPLPPLLSPRRKSTSSAAFSLSPAVNLLSSSPSSSFSLDLSDALLLFFSRSLCRPLPTLSSSPPRSPPPLSSSSRHSFSLRREFFTDFHLFSLSPLV